MTTKATSQHLLKEEVLAVLNAVVLAQEEGNWEAFSECFAKGENVVHIGIDLDEYWVGWESFKKDTQKLFKSKKGFNINVSKTNINLNPAGDVAIYSQLIDTSLETKGDSVRIEGFRHTGVMFRTNDQWQIVQSHISLPMIEDNFIISPSLIDSYSHI